MRESVHRRGWVPHKIYRDKNLSGSTSIRPGLDEWLTDIRHRVNDVVVV